MAEQPNQQNINIKITDDILKGAYSNFMVASHNKEEFILDFMNVAGLQGIAVAKVFTSPGHFKRLVAALNDNLKKYEEKFGAIDVKTPTPLTSTSESSKFGF
jgi:hypothetical protein